ncbi:hypothetical protein A5747_02630 [Mycobacterium sp. IS-836]|uniref:PPE family protein n=1 Tax=Mycobacterium sp. IS-836 TaxID=1834160 RepID=UPI00096E26C6|nr:PPE family protein [Mycobacterium sp. IS-836]OMC57639.1 hypothetical protein A5747_02630 [Mycobacterium sp. IS-836]
MDFVFLPPEINSARMYTGPGSGPLLAAAGSWDSLSAELGIAAGVYESVLSGLTSLHWRGPASDAMTAAAIPYVAWLHAAAERAEQTAIQARAAAAAYELAYAMTVPPAAVAANRMQLALLIATNFFGQNTAAIAATEAQYAEYWAQDVTAMSGYATSSLAATRLTPFSLPRQATKPDGISAQTAAVAQANAGAASATPAAQAVSAAPSPASSTSGSFALFDAIMATGTALKAPTSFEGFVSGIVGAEKDLGILPALGSTTAQVAATPTLGGASGLGGGLGNVTATLARSGTIGSMSVPASWSAPSEGTVTASPAAPTIALAGNGLPTPDGTGGPTGMAGVPGMPGGRVSRATIVVPRYGARVTVMARPPAAG